MGCLITETLFPFIYNWSDNRKVMEKIKNGNPLSIYDNKNKKIIIENYEKQYTESLYRKSKLEDKAKSNIVAISVAITIIFGFSKILDEIYEKTDYEILNWIIFSLTLLSIIYMLIAGLLSFIVLMKHNTAYLIMLKDFSLKEKKLKKRYFECQFYNDYMNIIRNNCIFTSYHCIRNSIVILVIVFILLYAPFSLESSSLLQP